MEEPSPVTHMQVQKLVYYAQGWSLAMLGEPLFAGTIEAWVHGPVVRDLYRAFEAHDKAPIPPREAREDTSLSEKERLVVGWIWRRYGRYSASYLRDMTHREPPWKMARGTLGEDERGRNPISEESMRSYFGDQLARERRFNIDPEELERSVSDARSGKTYPFIP